MTEKDKEIVLRDLCARQLDGIIVQISGIRGPYQVYGEGKLSSFSSLTGHISIEEIPQYADVFRFHLSENIDFKPYLRPMSSMTEEEHKEIRNKFGDCNAVEPGVGSSPWYNHPERDLKNVQFYLGRVPDTVDWLNQHHFDYRGLIEKGLALPAPPDMYK